MENLLIKIDAPPASLSFDDEAPPAASIPLCRIHLPNPLATRTSQSAARKD